MRTKRKRSRTGRRSHGLVALALLAVTVFGCQAPEQPEPASTTEPPATSTALDLEGAVHIGMEHGSTLLAFEGELAAGEAGSFIVAGHRGDFLRAHVLTPGEDLQISVHRLDDDSRLDTASTVSSAWQGILPESIGYLIRLEPPTEATPFALEVEIPRRLIPDPETGEVTISGLAAPHVPVAYRLPVEATQAFNVKLTSPSDEASFVVLDWGEAKPLVHWDEKSRSFAGTAEEAGEYIIQVLPGDQPTEYELSVTLG